MDYLQGVKEVIDKILRFLESRWGRLDLKAILREAGELIAQVFGFMADIVRWLIDRI